MDLQELVFRLSRSESVDGIVFVGSTGTDALRPLSSVGGVWKPGDTNFQFRPGSSVSPELLRKSAQFWESLVAG